MQRVLPVVLAFAVLLAGCSGGDPGPSDAPAPTGAAPGASAAAPNATREPLAFSAAAQEHALTQDGAFAMSDSCLPFGDVVPCTGERVYDLTPILAADVPVQVSLAIEYDAGPGASVHAYLRFDRAAATTYLETEDDGELVAVVVMQSGGRVEAVVQMFFPSLVPPADVNFNLEARTVVRPDVVPSFLPVAVPLRPGESLLAVGDGLEDFVVIPPGGTAIHHLGPYEYNATSPGQHIVIVSGQGDTRLHGPPGTTMKALLVQAYEGEPHAVTGGQDLTWGFTIDGVPLYVGLLLETVDQANGFAAAVFHGNYEMTVTHAGFDVLKAAETGCVVSCGFSLVGSGTMGHHESDFLEERLGSGAYEVRARFETANGIQVREFAAYVVV